MSTYTREQIKSALRDSDNYTSSCGGELVGDPEEHRVDALAAALGLDVEDEKPEPGTWHIVTDGDYEGYAARVFSRIELHIFHPTGAVHSITRPGAWPALNPAKVVPAEPGELSEAEVGALFEHFRQTLPDATGGPWGSKLVGFRDTVTATVNAALAKHGHGWVEVSREQVRAGVDSACSDLFFSDEFKDMLTTRLTAAVEASK